MLGITVKTRAISSVVERLPYKQDVTGSSPVSPIDFRNCDRASHTQTASCSSSWSIAEFRYNFPSTATRTSPRLLF